MRSHRVHCFHFHTYMTSALSRSVSFVPFQVAFVFDWCVTIQMCASTRVTVAHNTCGRIIPKLTPVRHHHAFHIVRWHFSGRGETCGWMSELLPVTFSLNWKVSAMREIRGGSSLTERTEPKLRHHLREAVNALSLARDTYFCRYTPAPNTPI